MLYKIFVSLLSIVLAKSSVSVGNEVLSDLDLKNSFSTVTALSLNLSCIQLQNQFAAAVADISSCAVKNARPVTVCSTCALKYNNTNSLYISLEKNADCNEVFFNQDRISVLHMVFSSITNWWNMSNCDNCYSHSGIVDYSEKSPEMEDFLNALAEFKDCVNRTEMEYHGDRSMCDLCSLYYKNLTGVFNHIASSNPCGVQGVCIDIVDAMNISHHLWNDHYNCSHLHSTALGTYNVLMSVLISLSPLGFYVIARFISVIHPVEIFKSKRRSFVQNGANVQT